MCYKFIQFGDKKFNEKGCAESCSFFHPNVCRDLQKTRSCKWTECRFFHSKGTKKTHSQNNGSYNGNQQNNNQRFNVSTSNRFDPIADKKEPEIDQNALSNTLEKIMMEIADIRAEQSNQKKQYFQNSKIIQKTQAEQIGETDQKRRKKKHQHK